MPVFRSVPRRIAIAWLGLIALAIAPSAAALEPVFDTRSAGVEALITGRAAPQPLDPNFPEGIAPADPNDPRLIPAPSGPIVPEVAPVHSGDPRLVPVPEEVEDVYAKPEGAPVQPGDLRNVP